MAKRWQKEVHRGDQESLARLKREQGENIITETKTMRIRMMLLYE